MNSPYILSAVKKQRSLARSLEITCRPRIGGHFAINSAVSANFWAGLAFHFLGNRILNSGSGQLSSSPAAATAISNCTNKHPRDGCRWSGDVCGRVGDDPGGGLAQMHINLGAKSIATRRAGPIYTNKDTFFKSELKT